MLTQAKQMKIRRKVELWDAAQPKAKGEHPDSPVLSIATKEVNPTLFLRAAQEMGVSPEELSECLEQDCRENAEDLGITYEILRDSTLQEARKK